MRASRHVRTALWGLAIYAALLVDLTWLGAPPEAYEAARWGGAAFFGALGGSSLRHLPIPGSKTEETPS